MSRYISRVHSWALVYSILAMLSAVDVFASSNENVFKVGVLHAQEPPFVYFNPSDERYLGILIDLSEELGRRMGLEVEFISTPRNKLEANILNGTYNATFLAKSWVSIPEQVLFSEYFYVYAEYLYSTHPFESTGSLSNWVEGRTVCTRENFIHPVIEPFMEQKTLKRLNVSLGAPVIRIMMKDRCDLALVDDFRKEWLQNNIADMNVLYRTPDYVAQEHISLMLSKDWLQKLPEFNLHISNMKQSGMVDEIVKRHSTRKLTWLDSQ
ncbi:MAG: transporter substrate-binding domain-containing protein [Paraglaciecola sp.]|uniref:substrate-binding periplasmic protein n=1 Tax=Paraglaciecola sp. TaxID=1920173 RepID=UPI003299D55F